MGKTVNLTSDDIANLVGLNMQVAKVCVWASHMGSTAQAQRLLRTQGYQMDPVMIIEVGNYFIKEWQVDAPRVGENGRDRCFLCSRVLPIEGELCNCYKLARACTYITDVVSLKDIESYRDQDPRGYRDQLVSTHLCATPGCGQLFPVTLGFVEDTMRRRAARGETGPYRAPTICSDCLHTAREHKRQADERRHAAEQRKLFRGNPNRSTLGDKLLKKVGALGKPETPPATTSMPEPVTQPEELEASTSDAESASPPAPTKKQRAQRRPRNARHNPAAPPPKVELVPYTPAADLVAAVKAAGAPVSDDLEVPASEDLGGSDEPSSDSEQVLEA